MKHMCFHEPAIMHALLSKLADNVADYVRYQVRNPACLLQPQVSVGGRTHACSLQCKHWALVTVMSAAASCEVAECSLTVFLTSNLPCWQPAQRGRREGGGRGNAVHLQMLLSSLASHPLLQADAGAQVVQIFDSWASHLSPQDFDVFCAPYIKQIVDSVKQSHPDLPLILYISGSGGLLERMTKCGTDIISVDQSVDLRDAIQRIGPNFAVQVNTGAVTASAGGGALSCPALRQGGGQPWPCC